MNFRNRIMLVIHPERTTPGIPTRTRPQRKHPSTNGIGHEREWTTQPQRNRTCAFFLPVALWEAFPFVRFSAFSFFKTYFGVDFLVVFTAVTCSSVRTLMPARLQMPIAKPKPKCMMVQAQATLKIQTCTLHTQSQPVGKIYVVRNPNTPCVHTPAPNRIREHASNPK